MLGYILHRLLSRRIVLAAQAQHGRARVMYAVGVLLFGKTHHLCYWFRPDSGQDGDEVEPFTILAAEHERLTSAQREFAQDMFGRYR